MTTTEDSPWTGVLCTGPPACGVLTAGCPPAWTPAASGSASPRRYGRSARRQRPPATAPPGSGPPARFTGSLVVFTIRARVQVINGLSQPCNGLLNCAT